MRQACVKLIAHLHNKAAKVQAHVRSINTSTFMFRQNHQEFWSFLIIFLLHALALAMLMHDRMSLHNLRPSAPTKFMVFIIDSGQKDLATAKSQRKSATLEQAQTPKLATLIPNQKTIAKSEKPLELTAALPNNDNRQVIDHLAPPQAEPSKAINFRDQAKLIAKEMAADISDKDRGQYEISGEYYGTYDGDDTGSFYFNLDKSGNVLGSGTSRTARSNFSITGKITSDGIIQLLGKGLAGTASFDGKIQAKTGAVSGTWYLAKFGRGKFSGKRE